MTGNNRMQDVKLQFIEITYLIHNAALYLYLLENCVYDIRKANKIVN